MRLLFALELPPSMIETLTELQRRLLGIGIGGRAISQENFRMLFQVGGEVTEDDAQALIHKLETDLAVLPSPVLQIVGVGALVRSGRDNVYAQLGGDTEMLYRLKNDIGRSIDELGLALDLKPFAPPTSPSYTAAGLGIPSCGYAAIPFSFRIWRCICRSRPCFGTHTPITSAFGKFPL